MRLFKHCPNSFRADISKSAQGSLRNDEEIFYRIFRYEDFSMDPYNNTKEVFNFFGFSFHKHVVEFLDTHTKSNQGRLR